MEIIPAIDIMSNKCVRLKKGDPNRTKEYFSDIMEVTKKFKEDGAAWLHLIDLDATLGIGTNLNLICKIIKNFPENVQVGGGIRSIADIDIMKRLGAARIILGSLPINSPELIPKIIKTFGSEKITIAIDERDGKISFNGWKGNTKKCYLDYAEQIEEMGVKNVIYTSIDQDGMLKGPAFDKIEKLMKRVGLSIIASGGISGIADLISLQDLGVSGAIVGTALYEGKFTLKEATEVLENVG